MKSDFFDNPLLQYLIYKKKNHECIGYVLGY